MKTHTAPRRIFLIEWRAIARHFLTRLFEDSPDFTFAGWSDTARISTESILARKPDLVLTDMFLCDLSGLHLTERLAREAPHLPVFMYGLTDDAAYPVMALEAGAKGYTNATHENPDSLLQGIHKVLKGENYLGGGAAECVAQVMARDGSDRKARPSQVLSPREFRVFHLIGEGMTTGEIAQNLTLSKKTVLAHRASIQRKMGYRTSAQLMHFAVRWYCHQGMH